MESVNLYVKKSELTEHVLKKDPSEQFQSYIIFQNNNLIEKFENIKNELVAQNQKFDALEDDFDHLTQSKSNLQGMLKNMNLQIVDLKQLTNIYEEKLHYHSLLIAFFVFCQIITFFITIYCAHLQIGLAKLVGFLIGLLSLQFGLILEFIIKMKHSFNHNSTNIKNTLKTLDKSNEHIYTIIDEL